MNALLMPLVESPELVMYVEELQEILAAERVKREKFYEDISPDDKWEFINGEVIMHSPATAKHVEVTERLHHLLKTYALFYGLGSVHIEKVMVSLTRNDYEPDIVFYPKAIAASFQPTQWKFPAPALIVETLSPSTRSRDRGIKFRDYAAHAVAEYWIVDPEAETIEQYLLVEHEYRLVAKHVVDSLASSAISGFRMQTRAAFDDRIWRENVREILLSSPEEIEP